MAPWLFHVVSFFLLLICPFASSTVSIPRDPPGDEEAFTSVLISQNGLDFIKDLLVTKAISSIVPLQLPRIEKVVKIPFLGNVQMVLTNATIDEIGVPMSYVRPGDTGIAIIASDISCNLSMNWHYSYTTWVAPIEVSDKGRASVRVEGMELGLTLSLENDGGTLKLSLLECGCHVHDILIKLDGGASWLYQGMLDAFEEQISSAVEKAITRKLEDGALKLDSVLEDLPREVPVDDNAAVNVTFVGDPLLTNSSIGLGINGLFVGKEGALVYRNSWNLHLPVICGDPVKMLGISLDETVFKSAAALYYDAEFMQWVVDKVPDQSLLNTAGWRFVIPQLYKKYPNRDMDMNISLSAPPEMRISDNRISATVYADLIIDVLEADEVIPVACISLVIRGSGAVKIVQNNLAGSVKLSDFSMSLKWSNIGNLRIYLIQPVIWTAIETVFVPYVNSHLGKGFPLPIIHGFTLQNAEIMLANSRITVSSDVSYAEDDTQRHTLPFDAFYGLAQRLPEVA